MCYAIKTCFKYNGIKIIKCFDISYAHSIEHKKKYNFQGAGIEKKYESTDFKDFGVPAKLSPSYTKIHVDKDTGPDYCYTAIGNNEKVFDTLKFLEI